MGLKVSIAIVSLGLMLICGSANAIQGHPLDHGPIYMREDNNLQGHPLDHGPIYMRKDNNLQGHPLDHGPIYMREDDDAEDDDADKVEIIEAPQKVPAPKGVPTKVPTEVVPQKDQAAPQKLVTQVMAPQKVVPQVMAPQKVHQEVHEEAPEDMCAEKINEEMKVIEETLTRCAEEGHSGAAFDYCVVGICGTEFTASYTVCQQSMFWRLARDCDTRVCIVDLRKFWLTTPSPNGYQLPTGNGNGSWKWVPHSY